VYAKGSIPLCPAKVPRLQKSKVTTSFLPTNGGTGTLLKQIRPIFVLVIAAHAVGAPVVSTPTPRYATQLKKFSGYENFADGAVGLRVSVRGAEGQVSQTYISSLAISLGLAMVPWGSEVGTKVRFSRRLKTGFCMFAPADR
jgi:hypothetical protein